ncbi:aldehyde dehydrogenase [Rhodococcus opacus]|uniref:aldehyde dehydrogenase n=1 Tax=Rhodococcus opacus TaxID=37919 RepID=UPI001469B2A5|nr:aldehyde dehydrogenase [Rhodococcus opacus]MDV7088966.1 aldehyde dehydrogenase [Rhodococcus opacus]WKN60252.1 aldehyde dehydrogenase [Rhodococcus opacus]
MPLESLDHLIIGGAPESSSGGERIEVISPFTEQIIATVPAATVADVDRAVAAARAAFDTGAWPRMAPSDRLAVLRRFRDTYAASQETIAETVTAEMGCPISLSRSYQTVAPKLILDAYLEIAAAYPFESVRRSDTGNALVVREPVGVVAAVVPWNVPQATAMQKVIPALLAGCTVVLKPSPETPIDAYILADLLHRSGVPDGVLSVLPAGRDVSEYLISHPGVDKVSFTGSTVAGRRIASICGNDLRRVTLELGGKSAGIFLDDADFDAAVESLRFAALRNSGQVCSLKTRLLVSKRKERDLVDRLEALIATMPLGDPADADTQIGPMVTARQRARIENYLEIGRAEGASAVVGGGRPSEYDTGWFVEPTVFTGVTSDMRIAQEEIFGPVLSVITYEDEDEAVRIANHSTYGLSGAIYTSDVTHGVALARRIRTGTVELNGSPAGFHAPMGGVKNSGIGREAGPEGLEVYTEPKSIGVPASFADEFDRAARDGDAAA